MFDMQKMMKQAQDVQARLEEIQEKLADLEVNSESGGGLVKVKMTCGGDLTGLDIDQTLLDGDKETLEDLIIAAISQANVKKDDRIRDETRAALKELGVPENVAETMGGNGGGLPF